MVDEYSWSTSVNGNAARIYLFIFFIIHNFFIFL